MSGSVFSLTGNSSSYTTFAKLDFGTALSNNSATSDSYSQRFILGVYPVNSYALAEYCGRFGVLGNLSSACNDVSYCGNGVLEDPNDLAQSEECDGADFGGLTCGDLVAGTSGTLVCTSSCVIDTGDCDSGRPPGGGGGSCTDQCSQNGSVENVCLSDSTLGTRTCGNYDADSCLEWSDYEDTVCVGGSVCEFGSCVGSYGTSSCKPDWECGSWGSCTSQWSVTDVLTVAGPVGGAYEGRGCVDRNNCAQDRLETRQCGGGSDLQMEIREECFEEYLVIYSDEGEVAKVRRSEVGSFTDLRRVDISFTVAETPDEYCDYCYNGVQDYDETGVDCGGPNCPACPEYRWYFDWAYWVAVLLWIVFFLALFVIIYIERREIRAFWHWFQRVLRTHPWFFDKDEAESVLRLLLRRLLSFRRSHLFGSRMGGAPKVGVLRSRLKGGRLARKENLSDSFFKTPRSKYMSHRDPYSPTTQSSRQSDSAERSFFWKFFRRSGGNKK